MALRADLTAAIFATLLIAKGFSAPTAPPNNVTISGVGISDHGEANLLCVPISAYDVLIFFLSNYLAHAITVKLRPGASMRETFFLTLNALLHPAGGINTALDSILAWSWKVTSTFPFFKLDVGSLETARRSGALVVAMRNADWEPAASDEVLRDLRRWEDQKRYARDADNDLKHHPSFTKASVRHYTVQPLPDYPDPGVDLVLYGSQDVHGGFELPAGYNWATVPPDAKLLPYGRPIGSQPSTGEAAVHLTASFSITQPIVATYQALNAGWALYKTRGDQLQQYGFTAFGLTVTPYLIMSVVNFVAQLATPHYDAVYIVYSEVLAEAAARVGNPKVFGIVAALAPDCSPCEDYELFDKKVEMGTTETPKAVVSDTTNVKDHEDHGKVALQSASGATKDPKEFESSTDERGETRSSPASEVVVPWLPGRQRYKSQTPSKKVNGVLQQKEDRGPLFKPKILPQIPLQVGELIIPYHPRFECIKSRRTAWKIFQPESTASSFFQSSLATIVALFPLPVILAISRCKTGLKTTTAQKVIFIGWFVFNSFSQLLVYPFGILFGILTVLPVWLTYAGFVKLFRTSGDGWKLIVKPRHLSGNYIGTYLVIGTFLLLGAFSLAMFVAVGQELVAYGNCEYYG